LIFPDGGIVISEMDNGGKKIFDPFLFLRIHPVFVYDTLTQKIYKLSSDDISDDEGFYILMKNRSIYADSDKMRKKKWVKCHRVNGISLNGIWNSSPPH
jgi:hypothetical protein